MLSPSASGPEEVFSRKDVSSDDVMEAALLVKNSEAASKFVQAWVAITVRGEGVTLEIATMRAENFCFIMTYGVSADDEVETAYFFIPPEKLASCLCENFSMESFVDSLTRSLKTCRSEEEAVRITLAIADKFVLKYGITFGRAVSAAELHVDAVRAKLESDPEQEGVCCLHGLSCPKRPVT